MQRSGRDLYAELGVSRDADSQAIKKAYRSLAQQHHPDRNKDDAQAEERFKQISTAYSVLSDDSRRRSYDEFGEIALDPNFDPEQARRGAGGFGGGFSSPFGAGESFQTNAEFGSLFEQLFGAGGRSRSPQPQRGAHLETRLELDFAEAIAGCEKRVEVERVADDGGRRNQKLTIRIPAGVEDGGRIRLAGKGSPGSNGGPPGDLLAKIRVRPHPYLSRDGNHLSMEVPISVVEAIKGAEIEIPTLDGRVTLKVPAGTHSGTRLRLRGKGVPKTKDRAPGDLYVTVAIRVPQGFSPEQADQIEALVGDDGKRWRRETLG